MFIRKKDNDLLLELYNSKSLEELNQNFKILCENYNIDKFFLASLKKTEALHINQKELFSSFDTYPIEWMKRYKNESYHLNDPIFLDIHKRILPSYWHIDKLNDLTDEQKKIMSEACDFGINSGTTIPLLPNYKFSGLLGLANTEINQPDILYILLSASHIYMNHKINFDLKNSFTSLTNKELKILSLKAEGYIIKQISKELLISDATVIFHLKNIRKKLGLITTEQAILKYILLKK